MNLPYPGQAVSPFDVITAQFTNETIANIEALAGPTVKIGVIAGATLGTTGIKNITTSSFVPSEVRFATLATTGASAPNQGLGAMDSTGNQWYSVGFSNTGRFANTDACIAFAANSTSLALKASYVSMNSNGFSINVTTPSSSFPVAYEMIR